MQCFRLKEEWEWEEQEEEEEEEKKKKEEEEEEEERRKIDSPSAIISVRRNRLNSLLLPKR